MPLRSRSIKALLPFLICMTAVAGAQQQPIFVGGFSGAAPGVLLDTDGNVRVREVDPKEQLAGMRARARAAAAEAGKNQKLTFISLPKLIGQVRHLREQQQPIPESLKYLGGMTRLQYVFVFPDDHDLVIAGPAEPWQVAPAPAGAGADATEYVIGKRTGRPVMQLDDLIVALRTAHDNGGSVFGCALDPSPDSVQKAEQVEREYYAKSRAERMNALVAALGPQKVRLFGTRPDTRLVFMCVAADYELKRFAMGLDHAPVPNMINAVDSSRSAANKFWFEADYEPLLVSRGGDAFELRGQRLKVGCGAFDFDARGATEKAKAFADHFTRNVPALAVAVPLFAELQNIADESLLGNLIRHDHLAERIGWSEGYAWLLDDKACSVTTIPIPRNAQTLVSITNGSLVAGGVVLTLGPFVDDKSREPDDKQTLAGPAGELHALKGKPAGQTDQGSAVLGAGN